MRLLFTTARGIGDLLIRAFEGGQCSHVGIELRDGRVIDSAFAQRGVRLHPDRNSFLRGRTLVDDIPLSLPMPDAAEAWLHAQVGKPYDWTALIGFLLWRDWSRLGAWFCTEATAYAMLYGGITFADRHSRIGVRLLREIAHARAARDKPTLD